VRGDPHPKAVAHRPKLVPHLLKRLRGHGELAQFGLGELVLRIQLQGPTVARDRPYPVADHGENLPRLP
jgi:hypothetical protein